MEVVNRMQLPSILPERDYAVLDAAGQTMRPSGYSAVVAAAA